MEIDEREYNTVVLAALLHDVGKMLQRGNMESFNTKGKHPQVSAHFVSVYKDFFERFVYFELFQVLIQRHHEDPGIGEDFICKNAPEEYKALSYLISRADNYSSAERGDKSNHSQHYRTTPLVSIFSQIRLDNKPTPETNRYKLTPLSSDKIFPYKFEKYLKGEMKIHLEAFENDWQELIANLRLNNFDVLLSQIYNLLMCYAWCMPSDTQVKIPDVSLIDHLKTTAAIAACLYQYHHPAFKESGVRNNTTEKFILLIADLSGIQNYIFNITHIGAGGAAKRLRARSLQINIISEIISHRILHKFNLPICNILMSSGGKFYILLPKLQDIEDTLNVLRSEIDEWFYKSLNAEINLNMETMPISGNDFGQFGEVVDAINKKLLKAKKRPFQDILKESSSWNEQRFVINIDFQDEEKLCKACKKFPGIEREDGKVFCDRCNTDKEIGTFLPRTKYIAFYKTTEGKFKAFNNYSFDLLSDAKKIKANPYLVLSMDGSAPNVSSPVLYKFIANHVSVFCDEDQCDDCDDENCKERGEKEQGQIKYFNCIADRSLGRKMLGYLKGDVDNLGRIFKEGLGDNNTISRVATLSRMVDLFFSGYMQYLMGKTTYSDLYTVYSGGDDILVIGVWNKIVNFADELEREFKRFVCENESLTLSAGISFVKSKSPVFRSVQWADTALDCSKNVQDKNSLTVFGQSVKWEKVPAIISEAEKLGKWLVDKKVSTGFARNLLQYAQWYRLYEKERKPIYLRYLPFMTYDIARNLPPLDDPIVENQEIRLWADTLKTDINGMMCYLGIIANYALTANRGG